MVDEEVLSNHYNLWCRFPCNSQKQT